MTSQCWAVSTRFLQWHSSVGLFQLSVSSGVPVYPASIRSDAQWFPSVHWVNQCTLARGKGTVNRSVPFTRGSPQRKCSRQRQLECIFKPDFQIHKTRLPEADNLMRTHQICLKFPQCPNIKMALYITKLCRYSDGYVLNYKCWETIEFNLVFMVTFLSTNKYFYFFLINTAFCVSIP